MTKKESAKDHKKPPEQQTEGLRGAPPAGGQDRNDLTLEQAIQVLKDNGFVVLLDVKIEDCREEDGKSRRSFMRSGRYDVAIVGTRFSRF